MRPVLSSQGVVPGLSWIEGALVTNPFATHTAVPSSAKHMRQTLHSLCQPASLSGLLLTPCNCCLLVPPAVAQALGAWYWRRVCEVAIEVVDRQIVEMDASRRVVLPPQ
jgi:hypothetical protein